METLRGRSEKNAIVYRQSSIAYIFLETRNYSSLLGHLLQLGVLFLLSALLNVGRTLLLSLFLLVFDLLCPFLPLFL